MAQEGRPRASQKRTPATPAPVPPTNTRPAASRNQGHVKPLPLPATDSVWPCTSERGEAEPWAVGGSTPPRGLSPARGEGYRGSRRRYPCRGLRESAPGCGRVALPAPAGRRTHGPLRWRKVRGPAPFIEEEETVAFVGQAVANPAVRQDEECALEGRVLTPEIR